jgi:S-formylglutathione hydrolase FrmB
LCDEVVPWVDARYRTVAAPGSRAISGKSSGGFGAMITPMLRPDLFGALATHAGDALYEMSYVPEFGKVVRLLRQWDGDIFRWWDDFRSRTAFTKEGDSELLITLGCSAAFSARDDGTPELPFDARSGELLPDVWDRWLAWDPVRMVDQYAEALRGLRAVWIDAGTRDEWFLDLGAQAFRDGLARVGVPDDRVRFELFEGSHMAIDYRYPQALAWLAHRLSR